ncbi:Phage protein [Fimbriiglobus ruber]|uniref:Phage protein n=1 Tax=Fimbriiglobus ruber TaxID=1908690 RepID=A0A225D5P1_9BACT|nr:Phage protein [Fimbriiglobus ruber]
MGTYFGTGSEEYARAEFYFGWVSKNITAPQQISFWFWNDDVATADLIYGASGTYALATFTAITSGELTLTMGGFTHTLTGINLGSAGSLAAVATDIQTAIQAYSAGGAAWTGATVAYDSTNSRFTLTGGATGADTIAVTAAVSNDLAGPLGWLTGAILSNGTTAQTVSANLNALIGVSNNFGSFTTTFALALSEANTVAAATWNNSLTPNIQFIYSVNVTPANASSWSAALADIGGVSLTLQSPAPVATAEFPEMAPMMILAATDYTQRNSVQNYMFQQFALTPRSRPLRSSKPTTPSWSITTARPKPPDSCSPSTSAGSCWACPSTRPTRTCTPTRSGSRTPSAPR